MAYRTLVDIAADIMSKMPADEVSHLTLCIVDQNGDTRMQLDGTDCAPEWMDMARELARVALQIGQDTAVPQLLDTNVEEENFPPGEEWRAFQSRRRTAKCINPITGLVAPQCTVGPGGVLVMSPTSDLPIGAIGAVLNGVGNPAPIEYARVLRVVMDGTDVDHSNSHGAVLVG